MVGHHEETRRGRKRRSINPDLRDNQKLAAQIKGLRPENIALSDLPEVEY